MEKLPQISALTEKKSKPDPETPSKKTGRKHVLKKEQEFFMTLIRLRRNIPVDVLGDMFGVSTSTTSRIINTWILVMSKILRMTPLWRQREDIRRNLPVAFLNYPNVRAILDCTEMEIERPSDTSIQKETFSNYKQRNTVKGLIAISPDYQITFISQLYHGSTSDKKIVRHCGILDKFEVGDALMADRGFDIGEDCTEKGIQLIIPDFLKTSTQLTPQQVERTREIAKARIKVENKIGAVKFFKILHQKIPLTLQPMLDQIWIVCNYLVNFMEPIRSEEELYDVPSPSNFVDIETEDNVFADVPGCSRVLFPSRNLKKVSLPNESLTIFLDKAKENTYRNNETGAYFAGIEIGDKFQVTHMIIPKQNGNADSFVCKNYEEFQEILSTLNLIALGWIHTHPSHEAFMSSIDLHTQYAFQCLLPEFFAVVCSVIYNQNKIFTIEAVEGMDVIKNCTSPATELFHEHPLATAPIFHECSHIQPDPDSRIVVVDLR